MCDLLVRELPSIICENAKRARQSQDLRSDISGLFKKLFGSDDADHIDLGQFFEDSEDLATFLALNALFSLASLH